MHKIPKSTIAASLAAMSLLTAASGCTTPSSQDNTNVLQDVPVVATKSETDEVNLASSYAALPKDNVYKVVNAEDMFKFREHGTGILVLGFPQCPACSFYIPMLNELAKEHGIEQIVYYDIWDDREAKNETYARILSEMDGYTRYNNDGDLRIYVPSVSFIDSGKITFYDDETSELGKNDPSPEEYWTDEKISAWKERMGLAMDKIKPAMEECGGCGAG